MVLSLLVYDTYVKLMLPVLVGHFCCYYCNVFLLFVVVLCVAVVVMFLSYTVCVFLATFCDSIIIFVLVLITFWMFVSISIVVVYVSVNISVIANSIFVSFYEMCQNPMQNTVTRCRIII